MIRGLIETRWLLGVMVLGFALTGLVRGAPPAADGTAQAEAVVRKAKAIEKVAQAEWRSREMARSATREIARSERNRADGALADVIGGQETVKRQEAVVNAARQAAGNEQDPEKKKALAKADSDLAAAVKDLRQRTETMRAVVKRLMDDSIAGEGAAAELMVSENELRDKITATRGAERAVLELKAKAAEKAAVEAARRALDENKILTAWEIQQWAGVQKSTLEQIVEMTGHACSTASKLAAVEPDAQRKKTLEQFAQQEASRKAAAQKQIAEKNAEIDAAVAIIYPLRAAAMGGLEPLSPQAWDYAKARHLLVRAGFGGTPQEVQNLSQKGLYKAVDQLVEFYRQPSASTGLDVASPLVADPLAAKLRSAFIRNRIAVARTSVERGQVAKLRQWWLGRMVESPRPLQEKLALFWHGLFASQESVVRNSYTMYQQNQLFRQHAAGNYGGLLYGIVHDPAMIRFLDNNKNVKGEPNENLAREILELFSMGVDQGYTEQDIVEAARTLTGYNFDNRSGGFRYIHSKHDTGDKTIFGKTGPWAGDDLVRLILEQPATSRFIARRLFEYFACRNPKPETIERLANVLRTNNYELEPMLKNMFLSEDFYSEQVIGCQIKSPVELVVGTLRDLGVKRVTNYGLLDHAVQQMGQQLLEPPDVKGWRYGRSWISSSRVFVRYNSIAQLVNSVPRPGRQGIDAAAILETSGCKTSADLIDYLAKTYLMRPLSQEQRKGLIDFLGELPASSDWAKQRKELNAKLRSVLILMLSTPEYQMA